MDLFFIRQTQKKHSVFFILLLLLVPFISNAESGRFFPIQDIKVTIASIDQPILEVFEDLSKQSGLLFFYNEDVLADVKNVTLNAQNESVDKVLRELTKQTKLVFKQIDNTIAVSRLLDTPSGASPVTQQQLTVTGSITDENNEAMPGVNVVVKGSSTGVITDIDGKFNINVPSRESILSFSFMGYLTQEITIGNQTVLHIQMHEDVLLIEEVVVVGYGTMKKSDLTGSVVSIKMEDKAKAANVNLSQALQGYMAGVNVGGAARAGESGSISIRGTTSLSASEEPLVVVDGIIYNGSLSDIDVNDIEKVDILKDASAAAVYGSRSANGVIIITTKMGQSDKPLFNFNMYYGFQDMAQTKRTQVMNGDEYATRIVDYYYYMQELLPWYRTNPTTANGRPVRPDVSDRNLVSKSLRSLEEQENYLAGREVDWMDMVYDPAPIQSYNLSVSGKTNRTNYYLSGALAKQDGIIDGDDFKRFTLRANFENKITDWLSLGLNTALSRLDYSGYYNNNETVSGDGFYNIAAMTYALRASPLASSTDAQGNYPIFLVGESMQRHPLINKYVDDLDISNRVFLVLSAKIDVPFVQGLRYEVNYSETFNSRKQNDFFPISTFEGSLYNNYGTKVLNEGRDWLVNNILSYSKTFREKHSVNGTLLYSGEKRTAEGSTLVAYGFQNPVLGYNALHLGETQSVSSSAWEEASISYMARVNYAYDSKYLLTATYRKDGYSGFGENKKYADFPSISAAWVASRERFLSEVSWLDQLKLRLSYGLNGNQGIGRYASMSRVESTPYVFDANTAIGVYPSSMGNANLGWESTASTNVGLDIIVLNQRISAEIDVYNANTSDVLVRRNIPQLTGYSSVWTNIGGLNNKGIEIGLSSVNIKNRNLGWQSRVLFSLNRDKITELYGDGNERDLSNSWFIGEPVSAQYDYVVDGVWQEKDLFERAIMSGYYPGMYRLQDLNGDNSIDATNDRTIVGYSAPNYRFGINNSFTYKGFSLDFFINSIQGGDGYYKSNVFDIIVPGSGDYAIRVNRPSIFSYWQPSNPVNNIPAIYYVPPQTPGIYQDRSFVRLQDVTLSYSISKAVLNRIKLNSLLFYVSGKNLYTWTNWPGWDPEDDNTPLMRSVIGGIKMSF